MKENECIKKQLEVLKFILQADGYTRDDMERIQNIDVMLKALVWMDRLGLQADERTQLEVLKIAIENSDEKLIEYQLSRFGTSELRYLINNQTGSLDVIQSILNMLSAMDEMLKGVEESWTNKLIEWADANDIYSIPRDKEELKNLTELYCDYDLTSLPNEIAFLQKLENLSVMVVHFQNFPKLFVGLVILKN